MTAVHRRSLELQTNQGNYDRCWTMVLTCARNNLLTVLGIHLALKLRYCPTQYTTPLSKKSSHQILSLTSLVRPRTTKSLPVVEGPLPFSHLLRLLHHSARPHAVVGSNHLAPRFHHNPQDGESSQIVIFGMAIPLETAGHASRTQSISISCL